MGRSRRAICAKAAEMPNKKPAKAMPAMPTIIHANSKFITAITVAFPPTHGAGVILTDGLSGGSLVAGSEAPALLSDDGLQEIDHRADTRQMALVRMKRDPVAAADRDGLLQNPHEGAILAGGEDVKQAHA